MAKKTINAICDSIQINKQNSTARFIVEAEPVTITPGQPAQRAARTVISVMFDKPDGVKDFVINKETEITFSQK